MEKLNVSIGICAYNEAGNIGQLLESILSQKTQKINIEKILVVSDGCYDKTEDIVESYEYKGKIKLIKQKERQGKYIAINKLINLVESPVLVFCSADVILHEDAIENLCLPFIKDDNIGITGAHPVPENSIKSFMGYMVRLQWFLQDKLSLIQPKFGELIAIKNIVDDLPPTSVDEEMLAAMIRSKGFKLNYVPEAIVYNKGPENIGDYLKQRRRVYSGHLVLKKQKDYEVITLNGLTILKCLLDNLSIDHVKNIHRLLGVIFLEITGRLLGRFDILLNKKHYKWEIVKSTKACIK